MPTPRDRYKADRVGMVRIARYISDVISPPTIFAVLGIALGIYERPIWPGLAWAVIYGVIASLLPVLFIFYLLQAGRIGDLHMSNTGERNMPYVVGTVAALIAYGVISLLDGPELLRCLALLNIVALTSLGLINTRWLISIHATSIAAAWVIVTLIFGLAWSVVVLPVVAVVCWARYYLQRHTALQILAGITLGVALVLAFQRLGCFVP